MNYTSINYAVQNRMATITLNKPDRRNALDDAMIKELLEAFNSANRNSEVRAVILTGSGTSFCAGMDLDYLQRYSQLGHNENLEDAHNLMKLLQLIYSLKKPVIAALNGPAMGGGCGLAAACDFVYAGRERGNIGAPEVRLGFLPALILLFLIKRMGEGQAKEFVLRAATLDAGTAKTKGLVSEVVDDEKLMTAVRDAMTKGLEPAYNYYGVTAIAMKDMIWIALAALVGYVLYTVWYGYAILFLFEGWGVKLGH